MRRPLLLDLFCGAGGAAVGYHRAGFDVVGVDIAPQPHYIGDEFVRADAMTYPLDGFDAIHASPPCQHYAAVTAWRGARGCHPDLVDAVRLRLASTGVPWVIENVREAPLHAAVMLCGSMFGLGVRRHRYFEMSPQPGMWAPAPCDHRALLPFMHKGERAYADAMGCGWMTAKEGREAIPPAYTAYLGQFLLAAVLEAA